MKSLHLYVNLARGPANTLDLLSARKFLITSSSYGQKPGHFPNIEEFNDWFSSLPQSRLPASQKFKDPNRDFLPDGRDIKFTHADLHRRNIMISSTAPFRVITIVDWGQAGWYPDYWEYCKALYTCWYENEWRRDWIDKFLYPRLQEFQVFSEYTKAIGAV
ncbi:hypothetical protein BJX63DRAFT_404421 [Aspergillus granulosus]|uniref:Aminoglycoside phosphotransferase domain-containing protein n=1 Tax=Aspergillus granulosus TaxID=176169 RepID=A0ABR4H3C5_9EURO